MKFATAYYLLLIYSTFMLQALIPVGIDCWSHIFAEAKHIMTVHAKYGSNHLEQELANENSDNSTSRDQNSVRLEETSTAHIAAVEYNYQYFVPKLTTNFSVLTSLKVPVVFIAKHIPPPKI